MKYWPYSRKQAENALTLKQVEDPRSKRKKIYNKILTKYSKYEHVDVGGVDNRPSAIDLEAVEPLA